MSFPFPYQLTHRGEHTARYRVYAHFNNGGDPFADTTEAIMEAADCARGLAKEYRDAYISDLQTQEQERPLEAWRDEQPGKQKCDTCSALSSRAPVQNGECIHCWMTERRIDVRRFYEETRYTQGDLYVWWLTREVEQ